MGMGTHCGRYGGHSSSDPAQAHNAHSCKARPVHHRRTRYRTLRKAFRLRTYKAHSRGINPGLLKAHGRDVSPKLTWTLGVGYGFSPASVLRNLLEAALQSPEAYSVLC